ncbi:hypothetical protein Vafri_11432, partial [Volvox africanus]
IYYRSHYSVKSESRFLQSGIFVLILYKRSELRCEPNARQSAVGMCRGVIAEILRPNDPDPTQVKEAMRADPTVNYSSCSDTVRDAMAADVMRSVKYLISDLLAHIPVLLYQVDGV